NALAFRLTAGVVLRKRVLLHDLSTNQVALDDLFENFRCAGVIPNGFGIYDRDWTADAHAQAVDFAAIDQRLGPGEFEFFKPGLEEFPRGKRLFARRTMGL